MRVIAGTYRSRPLCAPRGLSTRPTSDRLRETLFNILAPEIEGAIFADLYAGSGAVGIEALSRGASFVSFVENASPALAAIRANLASLGVESGFRIEPHSVSATLDRLSEEPGSAPWNIVFLDPPYEAAGAYSNTFTLLEGRAKSVLAPNAIVIAEQHRKISQPLADRYGALHRYRSLHQGDAALSFYRVAKSG